jgi:polyketide biosynthesis acyl carrier protein
MNKEDIFRIIVQHTCEVVPSLVGRDFSINDSLSELGANSIDRVEIITMTLESLAQNVPLISFAKAKNFNGLVNILHESIKSN